MLEAIGVALGKPRGASRAPRKSELQVEAARKLRGARLLLVEDSELNRELAIELLRNVGVEVAVANHGREALDLLARDKGFDGILMDCDMPIMDGFTATREIRRDADLAHIPIIAMTANVLSGDREQVLAAGMVDHIAKPLDVDEMFATIARWIVPAHPIATEPEPHSASAGSFDRLEMSGIDTEAGLARTMGNSALYSRLLVNFRDSHAAFADAFGRSRDGDDPSATIRFAHTLRGDAGNIGANDVHAAAGALERACRERASREAIDQLFSHTLAALRPVIEGLAELQVADGTLIEAAGIDKSAARVAVARLKSLLEESNLEATDVVEELSRSLNGTVLAGAMGDVSRAVDRFDVDAALDSLRSVAEAIERV